VLIKRKFFYYNFKISELLHWHKCTGRADWALAPPEIFLYMDGLVPYEDVTKRRYNPFSFYTFAVFTLETIMGDSFKIEHSLFQKV